VNPVFTYQSYVFLKDLSVLSFGLYTSF